MLLSLLEIFWTFFKIGLFTFGGGYAMIPLITEQVVAKGWATDVMIFDFIAISQSTPGVFAVNISTFIGFEQVGVIGAIVATIAVSLPSFIIIVIIAKIFHKFADNKYVIGFLNGAKPIIVGVILSVAVRFIVKSVLVRDDDINVNQIMYHLEKTVFTWQHIVIFVLILGLIKSKDRIHPIYIVVISGLLGYFFFGIL